MLNILKLLLIGLSRFNKDDKGQALVLVAVSLAVLLGFGALTTDLGFLFVQRRNAQNIADAAALAGAHNLPDSSKAENLAIEYVKKNGFNEDDVTVVTPYQGDSTKINVIINKEFPTSLARVLNIKKSTIGANAVGIKIPWWNGESLPLINTGSVYHNENVILITKKSPGDKSLLTNFYTKMNGDEKQYYVDYMNGVTIAQGQNDSSDFENTLKVKEVLEDVWKLEPKKDDIVFVLSIKSDIIDGFMNRGEPILVKDKHGNNQERYSETGGGLHAGDIIDKSMLVLLECKYISSTTSPANKNYEDIKLQFVKEYDIYKNEFPINYVNPFGGKSRLIE